MILDVIVGPQDLLLSADPSVNSPGLALWRGEDLIVAGRPKIPAEVDVLPEAARWLEVAELCWRWACGNGVSYVNRVRRVAYERPQWYKASKSKGDPNQLAGLVGVGASLAAIARTNLRRDIPGAAFTVNAYLPAEWSGGTSKVTRGSAWKSPRGHRVRERLTPRELALVPDQHDVIDAVAIGLFALGRFSVRRVYSSG